jgi:hypothetical protein
MVLKRIDLVNGSEPIIAEALAYLERKGIEKKQVRRISIDAEVGAPLLISVDFFLEAEPEPEPEPLGLTPEQRQESDLSRITEDFLGSVRAGLDAADTHGEVPR